LDPGSNHPSSSGRGAREGRANNPLASFDEDDEDQEDQEDDDDDDDDDAKEAGS
jgi:hypothetical protein